MSANPLGFALLTLGLIILGSMVGGLFYLGIIGTEMTEAGQRLNSNPTGTQLRLGVFVTHFCTFALPGLVALYLVYQGNWWRKVDLDKIPGLSKVMVISLFFVAALPLVGFSQWLNLQIDLPAWAINTEEQTEELTRSILNMEGPFDLLLALLPVAFAAGFGEELVLRGIVQGRVFRQLNPHLAIWLAAAIFGLMHFEMAGLLPRILLGAVLGYTYLWSGSLWVPIILHILFNGLQVVGVYLSGEYVSDTATMEQPNLLIVLTSLVITLGMGWWFGQGDQASRS